MNHPPLGGGNGFQYGWKKDKPSSFDREARHLLSALPPPPERASLRDRCGGRPGVLSQGRGDCVAHAVGKAVQVALTLPGGPPAPMPSRDWLYYQAGVPDGDQSVDNGRYIRNACDALRVLGWPDETDMPYGTWPAHPGGNNFRQAFDRRAKTGIAYHRITEVGAARIDAIKRAIANGFPVVGGLQVTQAFEDQTGLAPLPVGFGESLGGHAIMFGEYNVLGVKFQNSWDDLWGDAGWGYLAWEWMTLGSTDDLWVIEILPGALAVLS